ncbi:MAG: diacylglycerol kinase [Rhodococcus sp. (in: high G+C Gram-positive bacteria)]|uniref:diacylglycerol/lipid kinase family protein n=1 Tax=Rhodococcus sp. TaxID=1831 RepID=UPI0011FEC161|nr:diacylglycerol kinase family protein [Rhodococcus sp. (in: high G+C Gram-positive bacteria)]RZL23146.1 MAG: diacylglycerol kinase [Rhodococcus sp. (in: high G+C Gram-positive bacteria)]
MATSKQRWLARAAVAAAFAAVVVLLVFAGLKTLMLLIMGVGAVVVSVVAAYWFLTSRGFVRWFALAIGVLTPIVVLVFLIRANLLAVVLVTIGLLIVAALCARAALQDDESGSPVPEHPPSPAERPFFVMNPNSGGGKVGKFGLIDKARELGAEVFVLDAAHPVDVADVARNAVDNGADLLGVAGGDGTQALVAAVAAEHGLPYLVISAGTRNHFAADLGLDLQDPSRCLDALNDGVDIYVDLGTVGDRPFVNNASFGAYAEVVQNPSYRDAKTSTVVRMLPDVLAEQQGAKFVVHVQDRVIESPQAVLVSNGPYETDDLAGLGQRPRLDLGTLGVVALSVNSPRQALGLLRRAHRRGLTQATALEVIVDADRPEIPVGVDGEALIFPVPVRCEVRPAALRVRVPRNRPGVTRPRRKVDLVRLRQLAGFTALDA